jgi:hypothetical protein
METHLFSHEEAKGEIFGPNTWYGSSRILRNYARWKWPLPAIVPHGISLSSSFVWEAEAECKLKQVHVFPSHRRKAYLAHSRLKTIDGASPWLYLLRTKPAPKQPAIHTLAFPPHSSHHVKVTTDDDAYASFLAALNGTASPVAVCMYWRDIQLGRHNTFLRRGLRVLSAGHMFDELFFERLLHILQNATTVHSPTLGSHLFYAASAGCKVTYENRWNTVHLAPMKIKSRDTSQPDPEVVDSVVRAFSGEMLPKEQKQFADEFLGQTNLKSPCGLFCALALSAWPCKAWRRGVLKSFGKKNKHVGYTPFQGGAFEIRLDNSISTQELS